MREFGRRWRETMSLRKSTTFIALCGVAISLVASAQNIKTRVLRLPQDITFVGPGTVQTTVLYGDPKTPGMYVYRTKLALGSKNVPHWHPEERTVAN
jgi:hypothetical protein